MTGGIIAIATATGIFYFSVISTGRERVAQEKAETAALKTYVAQRGLGEPGLRASEAIRRLTVEHREELLAEARLWPGWEAEVRRYLLSELHPLRRRLSALMWIASVLGTTAVIVLYPQIRREDFAPVYWPVLMYVVVPFYLAAGAMDVADRLWRRRSARDRNQT